MQEHLIQSITVTPDERPEKLRFSVLLATLVACLGPLSFGFVLGYASPVKDQLQNEFDLNDEDLSWFNSIQGLGALVGSVFGIYSIDKFGRKLTIMLCSAPFVSGWVIMVASKGITLLFIGRVVTGVAVGAISLTVPVYIAEIAPAKYRGALGCGNQLAVTFGALAAYSLGPLLDNWRWLAIAGAVPPALMSLLMIPMSETPRWLVKNEKVPEAIQVLTHLRGGSQEESKQECQEILDTVGTSEAVLVKEILNPVVYRPLILAIFLMIFQQFGGINIVITYCSQIVKDAGFDNATVVSIVIAAVQFVVTAISCLIIDKLGRRILLIFPGILMAISMVLLGAYSHFSGFPPAVALISLSLYIAGFSLGWGPIPWLAMSEIFPIRVRGIASGIVTQVNWLGVFVVIKTFTQIEDAFHLDGAYWFYGAICLLSSIFVFFFFPETKGRTLEEIQELFSDGRDLRPLYEHQEDRARP